MPSKVTSQKSASYVVWKWSLEQRAEGTEAFNAHSAMKFQNGHFRGCDENDRCGNVLRKTSYGKVRI